RLDRAGVKGAPPLGHRQEVHGGGDERFAGAGRRIEDDVLAAADLEDGLFLGGIEGEPLVFDVGEEAIEHVVAAHVLGARRERVELVGEGGFLGHPRASVYSFLGNVPQGERVLVAKKGSPRSWLGSTASCPSSFSRRRRSFASGRI